MLPHQLSLRDFRNLAHAELTLAPRLTFLVGDNAQGKTNTLEALAYALTLRPLRTARPGDLIRRGAEKARVDLSLVGPALPWTIRVELDRSGRRVTVNDKALREPSNLLGAVALVAFTPDDLSLVKGGPELRRRSLDRFVFQVQPAHLRQIRDYQRSLRARNALLRGGERNPATLSAFSSTLASAGARVMLGRRMGVALLANTARARHQELAPGGGQLGMVYRPSVDCDAETEEAELVEALLAALTSSLRADLARKQTCKGPHHDELLLSLDDHPVRRFASQGQARSIVMALRLAEVDELSRARGRGPVLLADDLLAELDDTRASALLTTLDRVGATVVATGTRLPPGVARDDPQVALYQVCDGRVTAVEG